MDSYSWPNFFTFWTIRLFRFSPSPASLVTASTWRRTYLLEKTYWIFFIVTKPYNKNPFHFCQRQ
jgi:hypothetical protein